MRLTIITLVALATIMTYEHSLGKIYSDVKEEMRELGYDVPEHNVQVVEFCTCLSASTLGANYTMGAYGVKNKRAIVILINPVRWIQLTRVQKKLLIAHEWLHSGTGRDIYHDFYDKQDIMNYLIKEVTEENWSIWLEHTLKKNYLI